MSINPEIALANAEVIALIESERMRPIPLFTQRSLYAICEINEIVFEHLLCIVRAVNNPEIRPLFETEILQVLELISWCVLGGTDIVLPIVRLINHPEIRPFVDNGTILAQTIFIVSINTVRVDTTHALNVIKARIADLQHVQRIHLMEQVAEID